VAIGWVLHRRIKIKEIMKKERKDKTINENLKNRSVAKEKKERRIKNKEENERLK
jgi:hypothetical protein